MSRWGFLSYSSLDRQCGLRKDGGMFCTWGVETQRHNLTGETSCHCRRVGFTVLRPRGTRGRRSTQSAITQSAISRVRFTRRFSEGSLWGWVQWGGQRARWSVAIGIRGHGRNKRLPEQTLAQWPFQALISPFWGKLKWSLLQIPYDVTYVWSLTHVTNEPVYETGAHADRLAIDGGWGGEGELEAGERRRPRCCMLVGRANTLHGGAQGLDSISWSKPRWQRTNKSKTISPQRGPARGRSCFLFFPPFAGGPDPERSSNSGSGWPHAFLTKLVLSLQLLAFLGCLHRLFHMGGYICEYSNSTDCIFLSYHY